MAKLLPDPLLPINYGKEIIAFCYLAFSNSPSFSGNGREAPKCNNRLDFGVFVDLERAKIATYVVVGPQQHMLHYGASFFAGEERTLIKTPNGWRRRRRHHRRAQLGPNFLMIWKLFMGSASASALP